MRKTAVLAPCWVAVLAAASPAPAQSVFFDNYCVMGALQACASVRIFVSGNTLTMQVWNLHGVEGDHNTLTAIGLYHSGGTAWNGTVLSYSVTHVGGAGDITSSWTTRPPDNSSIKTLAGINIEVAAQTEGNRGIIGCGDDPGGGTHWATCASFPGTPYVHFSFELSEAFALENLELRWHSQQMGPEYTESTKCDTGGAGDYPECAVIPEPTTVVLLATGLLGIGAAVLRRRRNGLVVSDG